MLEYLIALKNVRGIGEVKFIELIEKYKNPKIILEDVLECSNLNELLEKAEKEIELAKKNNVKILSYLDENYPQELKNIHAPPPILYCKGDINLLNFQDKIAVVGTRKPSSYGKKVSEFLVKELVENEILVVSGLARGIDSIVHRTALENNGKTVAVIGNGIDVVYPSENRRLYEKIFENGLVVTEFQFGEKPEAKNFPKRNRIISGLSKGVVVVEAGERSGSIITANFALEQGKEVFAVPSNIFSIKSRGCHYLIKNGAYPVETADDIIEVLFPEKIKREKSKNFFNLTEKENLIIQLLKDEPHPIDLLILKTGMSYSEISTILTSLQLKDLILELPGKIFTFNMN